MQRYGHTMDYTTIVPGAGSGPVETYYLLLEDNVSIFLLEDGTSKILIEH